MTVTFTPEYRYIIQTMGDYVIGKHPTGPEYNIKLGDTVIVDDLERTVLKIYDERRGPRYGPGYIGLLLAFRKSAES